MLARIIVVLTLGVATLADRYVWRGVTRVNGWVFQPAADLELQAGRVSLSVGAWGSIELSRAGAGDLGRDRGGLGEVDVEAAIGANAGSLALTAGWVRYTYHGDPAAGGRGRAQNTSELFAALSWPASRITPELTVFRDIGSVRGVYAEAGVMLPVFASPEPRPAAVISLRPTVAWSAGPGADRGLTHVDLPLTLDFQLPGSLLEPAVAVRLHTQWCRDGATRVTDAAGTSTRVKVWAEQPDAQAGGRADEYCPTQPARAPCRAASCTLPAATAALPPSGRMPGRAPSTSRRSRSCASSACTTPAPDTVAWDDGAIEVRSLGRGRGFAWRWQAWWPGNEPGRYRVVLAARPGMAELAAPCP